MLGLLKIRLGEVVLPLLIAVGALTLLALPASASASLLSQCDGNDVGAEGSTLQQAAQRNVWSLLFNVSTNEAACNGTQGAKFKPRLAEYRDPDSGVGLESWGANGHTTNYSQMHSLLASDEPPGRIYKEEIESHGGIGLTRTLETIPVAQESVAVIVNLPEGCTATSRTQGGRLVMNNVTLEGIFRGTITKWSEITEGEDALSGVECDPSATIKPVVRSDVAGVTHVFKMYLGLIGTGWRTISEGELNTVWPNEAHFLRASAPSSGEVGMVDPVAVKVAEIPSSIGFAGLAMTRINGSFSRPALGGGPHTSRFWVALQDNGLGTTSPKYADPSTNKDVEARDEANCKNTEYTNGSEAFPPLSVSESWSEVTSSTSEKKYTLCALTYDLAFKRYSSYPETGIESATTVNNYLNFIVNSKAGGGQKALAETDYLALPKGPVLAEAQDGAEEVAF